MGHERRFRPRLPRELEAALKAEAAQATLTANDLVVRILHRAMVRRKVSSTADRSLEEEGGAGSLSKVNRPPFAKR